MGNWTRKGVTLLLAAVLLAGMAFPAFATEEAAPLADAILIHTPQELQAMAENPSGSYVLAEDLDMTGFPWKPVDFTGTFDGAGHAILNLTLSQLGDEKAEAHDGNRKAYEASYVGMFGTLKNAQVKNLKLLNVRGVVEVDVPCFMGGLAGYSFESNISGCDVSGVLELRAYNQIFGVAGMVGYGSGIVDGCSVDVTLICVDTDSQTKDEQFLGGVYSTGFMDVTNTTVTIEGFASEHGYAHNGGIVGMYMQHPLGTGKTGNMIGNRVKGRIKFFEDNRDRRAYCDAFAGEMLLSSYRMYDNLREFTREEVRTYDVELRPCMCEEPNIREYTVYSNCKRYGHLVRECYSCGYMDKDHYTMLVHPVQEWTVVEEPTYEKEGLSKGICTVCDQEQTRVEPMLIPEPTEAAPVQTMPAQMPAPTEPKVSEEEVSSKLNMLLTVLVVALVLLLALLAYLVFDLVRGRKRRY